MLSIEHWKNFFEPPLTPVVQSMFPASTSPTRPTLTVCLVHHHIWLRIIWSQHIKKRCCWNRRGWEHERYSDNLAVGTEQPTVEGVAPNLVQPAPRDRDFTSARFRDALGSAGAGTSFGTPTVELLYLRGWDNQFTVGFRKHSCGSLSNGRRNSRQATSIQGRLR